MAILLILPMVFTTTRDSRAQGVSAAPRKTARPAANVRSPLARLKRRSPTSAWRKLSRKLKLTRPTRTTAPESAGNTAPERWHSTPRFNHRPNPFPAGRSGGSPTTTTAAKLIGRIGPTAAAQQLARAGTLPRQPEPIPKPNQLKSISSILPYADYAPDLGRRDPCQFLCPRPEGKPCKAHPPGTAPQCPREQPLSDHVYAERAFPDSIFQWEASDLNHNPLYFEDPALERYGHTYPAIMQPFASATLFGLQLFGLPYQMTLDPIHKRQYALGWYRPGECAPKKLYQIPLNAHAAAVEAGTVTGLIFLFP